MPKSKELSHGDLVRSCLEIETKMAHRLEEFALLKFDRGCLLHNTVMTEKQHGAGLMESLAAELEYSPKTLYEEHSFARRFNFDRKAIEVEIERNKKLGKRITYQLFRKQLDPADPEVVGGVENHKDLTARKVEDLAKEVVNATNLYPDDEQVQGAVQVGVETLREASEQGEFLVGNVLHPTIEQGLKVDLPHYRAWIRLQPCILSGRKFGVQAHHLVLRARGENSLDIFCLPLIEEYHEEYHKIGHTAFEAKYQLDLRTLCLGFIQQYILEHK